MSEQVFNIFQKQDNPLKNLTPVIHHPLISGARKCPGSFQAECSERKQ